MWLLPVAVTRLLLFQSMGSGVLAHGLSVWNLPELGNEPVSPASAGGLSATGLPGTSLSLFLPEPSQIPPGSPALHGEASKLWSPSSQTTSCLSSFFLFLTPVFFLKWTYSKKELKNLFIYFFLAAP